MVHHKNYGSESSLYNRNTVRLSIFSACSVIMCDIVVGTLVRRIISHFYKRDYHICIIIKLIKSKQRICLVSGFSPSEDGLLNFLCILHSVQLPTMALHASDITEMQPFLLKKLQNFLSEIHIPYLQSDRLRLMHVVPLTQFPFFIRS